MCELEATITIGNGTSNFIYKSIVYGSNRGSQRKNLDTRLIARVENLQSKATVYSYSQSAIHLCKDYVFHDKTKHVEIKYHFIIEKVAQDVKFDIDKVPIEENPIDMGTKILTLSRFNHCHDLLRIKNG